ncbi:MAG: hypothetical protein ACXWQQ_17220 [Pseudobdellovibrio sp.]
MGAAKKLNHPNTPYKKSTLQAVKKANPQRLSPIARIFEELEETASINERDLSSYLDVSDKTLRNWKSAKVRDVSSTKVLRLRRLKEVVDEARGSSFSKPMIRQLLISPLDITDSEQKSIVDLIRSEPETQFFTQILKMHLENFKVRHSANGHFVLSNDDFDRLAKDLQEDKEPSEAVKNARDRFAKLRKDNLK